MLVMQMYKANHSATDDDFFKGVSKHRASLMGLSILSVMLFHQYFTSIPPFNFFHNYGYWGVDIFLFLSGMGMVSSLQNHTLAEFYKRRCSRILPICIVCGTLKYITFLLMGTSVASIQEGLHLGWWSVASLDLWYVNVILIFYAVSPLLYKSLNHFRWQTLFIIFVLFCLNGLTLRPKVGHAWMSLEGLTAWSVERLPVFVLGMLVAMRKDIINKRSIAISTFFLINAISIVVIAKTFGLKEDTSVIRVLSVALEMASLVSFCVWALNRTPSIVRKFMAFMGKHSLEIYLVHEFVFTTLMVLYNKYCHPFVLLGIAFSMSIILAQVCNLVSERWSYLYCFINAIGRKKGKEVLGNREKGTFKQGGRYV